MSGVGPPSEVVAWVYPKGVVKVVLRCATYSEAEVLAARAHRHYYGPDRRPGEGDPRFMPRESRR